VYFVNNVAATNDLLPDRPVLRVWNERVVMRKE